MIGFLVQCDKCETDRPDVVYYVGKDSTHCADCWISIVAAMPNLNYEAGAAARLAGVNLKKNCNVKSLSAGLNASVEMVSNVGSSS